MAITREQRISRPMFMPTFLGPQSPAERLKPRLLKRPVYLHQFLSIDHASLHYSWICPNIRVSPTLKVIKRKGSISGPSFSSAHAETRWWRKSFLMVAYINQRVRASHREKIDFVKKDIASAPGWKNREKNLDSERRNFKIQWSPFATVELKFTEWKVTTARKKNYVTRRDPLARKYTRSKLHILILSPVVRNRLPEGSREWSRRKSAHYFYHFPCPIAR